MAGQGSLKAQSNVVQEKKDIMKDLIKEILLRKVEEAKSAGHDDVEINLNTFEYEYEDDGLKLKAWAFLDPEMRLTIQVPRQMSEGDFNRTIWKAKDEVREEHDIDFAPVSGKPGFVHCANCRQLLSRSRNDLRAARNKQERACDRLDLAAKAAEPDDKARIENKVAHHRTQ
jgi:hypothetical protein